MCEMKYMTHFMRCQAEAGAFMRKDFANHFIIAHYKQTGVNLVTIIATLRWASCGPVPGPQDAQRKVAIIVTSVNHKFTKVDFYWFVFVDDSSHGKFVMNTRQVTCPWGVLGFQIGMLSTTHWLVMLIKGPKRWVGGVVVETIHFAKFCWKIGGSEMAEHIVTFM